MQKRASSKDCQKVSEECFMERFLKEGELKRGNPQNLQLKRETSGCEFVTPRWALEGGGMGLSKGAPQ